MGEAERVCEVTRRMHVIASTAEGQTLTLSELEQIAEQELAEREARADERSES
jgi:hypothetical protein